MSSRRKIASAEANPALVADRVEGCSTRWLLLTRTRWFEQQCRAPARNAIKMLAA